MELRLSDEQLERYGEAYQRLVMSTDLYGEGSFLAYAQQVGLEPGSAITMPTFEEYVESYERLARKGVL